MSDSPCNARERSLLPSCCVRSRSAKQTDGIRRIIIAAAALTAVLTTAAFGQIAPGDRAAGLSELAAVQAVANSDKARALRSWLAIWHRTVGDPTVATVEIQLARVILGSNIVYQVRNMPTSVARLKLANRKSEQDSAEVILTAVSLRKVPEAIEQLAEARRILEDDRAAMKTAEVIVKGRW